ncbi:hypothetical protein ACL2XG_14140 [Sodalis sp. RH24]|uniref:hypothetical protein n=1 Tax=unclassified Sodalis (in: enterobacteria) TaxID=2636512 RepID=UPI0039B3E534
MNTIFPSLWPPQAYPDYEKKGHNKLNNNLTAGYLYHHAPQRKNAILSGEELFHRAHVLKQESSRQLDDKSRQIATLNQPQNIFERILYGLLLVSSLKVAQQHQVKPPAMSSSFPRPFLPPERRIKREALPALHDYAAERNYRLATYLNKNIGVGINPDFTDDKHLAIIIIDSIDRHPELMPDVARLTLYGSQLYGERRGETLRPLQQKGLIGQLLCQLIFREDNIALRIAKLFDANRSITHQAFAALVETWPLSESYVRNKWLWQEKYEAMEIPTLYLKSYFHVKDQPAWMAQNQTAILDLDNLWVGSLTWTLLHFGARAIVLDNPDNLISSSLSSLIELGIGLVSTSWHGLLATSAESTMYLGLVLYYLRARPELSIGQIMAEGSLDEVFAWFKADLEKRHLTAQHLYDSFSYYKINFQRPVWRSRKSAAEELLKQHCGSAQALIMGYDNLDRHDPPSHAPDPVGQLMRSSTARQCVANGASIPNLDTFYRREVDRFAMKIRALDTALLEAVFMPSDVLDDNLQADDERFLQGAEIKWVAPRLTQRRTIQDMFYSNKPIHYLSKPDTFFFQGGQGSDRRLFALRITDMGYLLRKIAVNDPHLGTLMPFMADWPLPERVSQHEFTLLPLNNTGISKEPNETLSLFLERYADFHYQLYRLKIHEMGYEEEKSGFHQLMASLPGLIIPFYGCANALHAGQAQDAFTSCLMDGALVGLPLVFTGVRAGLGLFRSAAIGAARTLSGPVFSASGQEVFRNIVPTRIQLAGGIEATHAQLWPFMDTVGKGILKSVDPGFAAARSLSILTKGLYLALLGRTTVGVVAWRSNIAKVTSGLPKFVPAIHVQDAKIVFGAEGRVPLTVAIKGVIYPVAKVQNSSIVAVETGERTLDGKLLFVQMDLQSQFGIYKKYYCLETGSAVCNLAEYSLPDFRIEKNAEIPPATEVQLFWPLSSSTPIYLLVVHPLHILDIADKTWVMFEINGRRWAFSRDNGTLMPADNLDDAQVRVRRSGEAIAMIHTGDNDRTFSLRFTPMRHQKKREAALPRVLDWHQLLTNYTLNEDESTGFNALIHDETHLDVQIGDARYLLLPEKNAATFLMCHPAQANAPVFRVAYQVGKGDFVFASPCEPLNAHHIGELLRRKIADHPQATQEPYINILLPPLVNGAFRYGNKMFLNLGGRFLHIAPFNGVYHTLSLDEGEAGAVNSYWTLRYELFTGCFDIIDISDRPPAPGHDAGSLSRFEKLAARTYAKSRFPSLAALCRRENATQDAALAQGHPLRTRLRQVALLLRLDPLRRDEILHASSSALRTFKMDKTLPAEWTAEYPPLALWATLVNVVAACQRDRSQGNPWSSRQLAFIADHPWHFFPPLLITQGPDCRATLINEDAAHEVIFEQKGIALAPLASETGYRRWFPAPGGNQPTIVTKFILAETQQPIFWVDGDNQIWAQTPDGVKTRLYRQASHHPVDDIIVSPDGDIVVLVTERTQGRIRALYYHLPFMGSPSAGQDKEFFEEALLTGIFVPGRALWVTNQGDLYAPWEKHWSFLEDDHPRWATPEGFQPDFVSPDQRFLGFVKRDVNMADHEILLHDTTNNKQHLLPRSQPLFCEGIGLGRMVSAAFSALNALVAVGFADGYIEIFRIGGGEETGGVFSLGYARLPMGRFILTDTVLPKPKQMVMKFNNAFDQLLVFHDVGDFRADHQGNGTYAVSEISLAEL